MRQGTGGRRDEHDAGCKRDVWLGGRWEHGGGLRAPHWLCVFAKIMKCDPQTAVRKYWVGDTFMGGAKSGKSRRTVGIALWHASCPAACR